MRCGAVAGSAHQENGVTTHHRNDRPAASAGAAVSGHAAYGAALRAIEHRRARLNMRLELILALDGPGEGQAIALEALHDEMEFLRSVYVEILRVYELAAIRDALTEPVG